MNTRQHNLNPVERTIGAAGLSGLFGRPIRADRGYTDQKRVASVDQGKPHPQSDRCSWLDTGLAGIGTGLCGNAAEQPGTANSR